MLLHLIVSRIFRVKFAVSFPICDHGRLRTCDAEPLCQLSYTVTVNLKHPNWLAEREGFEPPERCRSSVFKTDAIDHSATSPLITSA